MGFMDQVIPGRGQDTIARTNMIAGFEFESHPFEGVWYGWASGQWGAA